MSATLDPKLLQNYFKKIIFKENIEIPIIRSEAKLYKIKEFYLDDLHYLDIPINMVQKL
jgi:hypothetical protein